MKRGRSSKGALLMLALSWLTLDTAAAEESSELTAEKFSVGEGIGFFTDDNFHGLALDFEGMYHINEHWSAGVNFQLGFDDDDFLLFSMPLYLQHDFDNFPVDVAVLKDMHAFLRFGLGFSYAKLDDGPINVDRTGFLFVLGAGVAYPITQHLSLESRMNINLTSNDLFEDDFYYSWQIVRARYRF